MVSFILVLSHSNFIKVPIHSLFPALFTFLMGRMENLVSNIRNLVYGSQIILRHPYVLQSALRILSRNLTNLVDYNLNDGRSFAPKGVTFRISRVCNLNCQMCIYRNTDYLSSKKMLPWDIFTGVIDAV